MDSPWWPIFTGEYLDRVPMQSDRKRGKGPLPGLGLDPRVEVGRVGHPASRMGGAPSLPLEKGGVWVWLERSVIYGAAVARGQTRPWDSWAIPRYVGVLAVWAFPRHAICTSLHLWCVRSSLCSLQNIMHHLQMAAYVDNTRVNLSQRSRLTAAV